MYIGKVVYFQYQDYALGGEITGIGILPKGKTMLSVNCGAFGLLIVLASQTYGSLHLVPIPAPDAQRCSEEDDLPFLL